MLTLEDFEWTFSLFSAVCQHHHRKKVLKMKSWSSSVVAVALIIISCFLAAARQSYATEVDTAPTLPDTLFFTAESHLFTSATTNVSFSLGQSYPPKERFSYEVILHLTKSASAAATSNAPCGKHCLTKHYTVISNATANFPLSVGGLLEEMESKFNRDEAKEEEEEMAIMKPSSTRYIHLFVKVFQMEAGGEARGKQLAANTRTIAITDNLIYYFDVVMSQAARPEYWSADNQFIRFEKINFAVEPKGWLESRLEDSRLVDRGDDHPSKASSTTELTYSWAITGPVKLTLRKPDVITSSRRSFSDTFQRSGKYMVAVDVVLTEEVTDKPESDGSSKSTTSTKRGHFTKMIEVKKRKHFF